ncbi:MAG: nitroreductase family protein [Proteiniphilum sp.]
MDRFQQLLMQRRSIRKYKKELLTPDETRMIFEAGLLSPTSKNRHSWEFIAVEEKETLARLSLCKPHSATFIADAALAVVVIGNPLVSDAWIEDASIAAINMQLQAEELGIGSCWVQVRNRFYSDMVSSGDYINELLQIPMPLEVVCVIAFGRKEKERTPADLHNLHWEKVHIETFALKTGETEF